MPDQIIPSSLRHADSLEPEATASSVEQRTGSGDPELIEVLADLRREPPRTSPKWFYDALGSALFESITRLEAYYPTNCELEILECQAGDIGAAIPEGVAVIELGCGSAQKVSLLMPKLRRPSAYVPVDVSAAAVDVTATEVRARFPNLRQHGIVGDFTAPERIAQELRGAAEDAPILLFFPGSTLGNFEKDDARQLLRNYAEALPSGSHLLLGIDLVKPVDTLLEAYDDSVGVTAAFNRNALAHLNRRFGCDFDPRKWRHQARWNPTHDRIEMWLISEGEQRVRFPGAEFVFSDGEGIHTESSHKWKRESMVSLASVAGWRVDEWWTDRQGYFAQVLLSSGS